MDVDGYVRKVLLDAEYILEPDCNTQARHLRESGRKFYDDKYKSHFDNLFIGVGDWFKAMGYDPFNKRFKHGLGEAHEGFVIRQRGKSDVQEVVE